MNADWIRKVIIDILGQRDLGGWRATERKDILHNTNEILLLQCDSKLGDAVYLSKIAGELIRVGHYTVRALVSEDLTEFWNLYVDPKNVVAIPSRRAKPTLLRYLRIYKIIKEMKVPDCLLCLDSGEHVDSFFIARTVGSPINIGCGKHHFRLFDYSIDNPFNRWDIKNVLEKVTRTLEMFNISYSSSSTAPSPSQLALDKDNTLFFNTYSGVPERSFSDDQVSYMTEYILRAYGHLVSKIVLSIESRNLRTRAVRDFGSHKKIVLVCGVSIARIVETVAQSNFIITPDTGIAHLEGALNCRKLIFYTDNFFNPRAWGVAGLVCNALPKKRQIRICDIPEEELRDYIDKLFSIEYWRNIERR